MTRCLVCLLLVLQLVASQNVCPLPSTSLLRRTDLARCAAGDRPPPPAETKSAASEKEPELPSFDEWKEKHAEELKKQGKKAKPKAVNDSTVLLPETTSTISVIASQEASVSTEATPAAAETPRSETAVETEAEQASTSLSTTSYVHPLPNTGTGGPEDPLLPLRSRTNYASQDCAASVLQSSKVSKHAMSVLNSKKDRYMLTPCNADPKYIIVELCEEIDIDTVVLANWEFFSSMFKLFRASVSEIYPGRDEDWRELGVFRAGNLRGSQVFKPKKRGGFYRYIRLDFLTHYGTEYYCPVSLLEVYGRTQMESYRDEERAKEEAMRRAQAMLSAEEASEEEPNEAETAEEPKPTGTSEAALAPSIETASEPDSASAVTSAPAFLISTFTKPLASVSAATEASIPSSTPTKETTASAQSPRPTVEDTSSVANDTFSDANSSKAPSEPSLPVKEATNASIKAPSSAGATLANSTVVIAPLMNATAPASSERDRTASTIVLNSNVTATNGARVRNETRSSSASIASATGPSGESIYGTIMKRLTALENNATLGFKYIEEQRKLVSASIAKLEKQFAASEASRKQDSQLIRRLILDFDLHRAKLEEERQTLAAQVTVLANEIVLERRLGLAQLLALLVVLAFVALTRGSSTPLVNFPVHRSRWSTSPTDLLRHKSLDRPRRAHGSLPADKLIARTGLILPRAPPARRSLGNGVPPNRNHRRTRSLTPPTTELDLTPAGAFVPPSPLHSERWVSSSESDAEDERPRRPSLTLNSLDLTDKPDTEVQSPADVTTPTLSDALRPIVLNA